MTGTVAFTSTAAAASPPVTSLLGDQSVATTHDGGTGTSEAFGYTAGATGTATTAYVYLDTTDGVRVDLYADNSGKPGAKLSWGSVAVNRAGWVGVPQSSGVHIVQGTRYWIAIAGTAGGGTVGYRDTGSSGSTLDYSGTGLANPYSIKQQWNSNPASVYIGSTVSTSPVAPSNTAAPTITGTAQQGSVLTDGPGTWAGTAPISFTYQWQRSGTTNIAGATSSSYTPSAADVGDTLDVRVTASNSAGSASASSAPTAPVVGSAPAAPVNTTIGLVSGTTTQGQYLTTTNGSWSGSPTTYAYQWQDCGTTGAACASISGATSASHLLASGDVGHTMRAVVTARNAYGSATATSAASVVVTATSGGLPPGVTLKPIDGGPSYYCAHGFTNACNGGWDSPSFFPIGPWYGTVTSQADVARWKDLGLNTAFRTTGNTSLSLLKANGLFAIVDDEGGNPESPGMGSETVGLVSADEPGTMSGGVTGALGNTPNSQQDGRFWYINNTWNFIYYGGLSPVSSSATVLATNVTTPDGTSRHIDTQSVDTYWFSGAKNVPSYGELYEGGLLYGIGVNANTGSSNMTVAEAECGCRYGDLVDMIRAFQATYPAPIAQFVETGGPYNQDTSAADYITPPEMNWAAWSSIIHGARQLIYFNHTFAGPAESDDNFADSYYQTVQPGQVTSIYAQAKATDTMIATLAPVINSPTALGYVTSDHPPTTFGGVETMAKSSSGQFYVFADTRNTEASANLSTTFTTADHYTGSVTVMGENRTLQAVNGVFTDTFARGSTVHIYKMGA